MIKKYIYLTLLLLPILCLSQNIPAVSNPVAVNKQSSRSKIPDNQIQNYKYVWYLIYPDNVIKFVKQMGGNQPKEVGPLTEQTCMAAIQDCKQEGITVGYSKRLNPQYKPTTNKETGQEVESANSHEGEYTYDPMDDAIKRMNQKEKKPIVNDPDVVDLSGLKDPYSARTDPFKLKDPAQTNISKEKCQEAINYADNRIKALNQLISNSENLVAQQKKSIETWQNEVTNWATLDSENKIAISKDIDNAIVDELNDKAGDNYKIWGKASGLLSNADEALSLKMENPKEDFLTKKLPKAFLIGVNTIDAFTESIPGLNKVNGLYYFAHKTLVYAPLATDMLLGVGYSVNLQDANKKLAENKLNADLLNGKIASWKKELRELNNCGTNCDLIRSVMNRYRPDLR